MSPGKRAKKPISKVTEIRNAQLRRRRGVLDLPERYLIVCEDEKSAPDYFEAFKKEFHLDAASIEVAGSGGRTQPVQVVAKAVELKKNAADPDSGTVPFDHVWCVIDGDYGSKIRNARAKAKRHKIQLAISTMCFEHWILLHFEDNDTAALDCDHVVSSLKRAHLPDYTKGAFDFREVVKHVSDASRRAKKLRRPSEKAEDQNPCSDVYLLVDAILKGIG